jgi:hypothetical protein
MADEIIQDPLEAANYLLRQYRDNPNFEFTQEEASLVHNAYKGGVSFVDSKPVMDEASTSSFLRSQDESDPSFIASEEEFSILKATEPGAISRIGAGMTGAAEYFGPVIKEGIPELIKTASMREPRPGEQPTSLPATLLEAGARGTMDLGMMAVGASKFIEKAPYMAAGALGMQDDYKSYLNQKTIDQNYQMQAVDKINAERAQGKSIIGLPEGTFAPKAAEAASMVLDPTLAVPFIGPGAKATGVAGRGLKATSKIAGGLETAARATGGAIDLGVEKVGQGIQRVLPGVTAPRTAGAIATGAAAIGIPGAFPIGAKIAGVRAGAEAVERGAQAVRIAGEEAMTGPSRMTVMERVAKNQKNPEWLRKAANNSIVSSPITQGAAELGLETGKGAVKSAAVGAGLGYVASGGEEEGIGGGLVIGGGLGAVGGGIKGITEIPAKKALAKQGDVNRLFKRQMDLGLDVGKISDYIRKDNRPFLDAATLQMMAPDVQVEFHGRDSFMMPENAGINAAGVVKAIPDKSGTTRLLVNMDDMRASGDTVKHEIMHAIMKSPAINKAEGRMAVMSEYGEEGLRRFGNEYARKLLEGERQGRGTPTEAEVRAKANELREGSQRSEPGAGDLDWIADEVLAEQFVGEFRGKDLDSLRRKTLPGTDLLSLQEGYLAPVGRLLAKFGIDTTVPKPTNIDTLFKDNPLVPSKQLRELTTRWFRDRDKYLDGLDKAEKQKDVVLTPGAGNRNLANNPAIKFTRNRKTNLEENDFAVKFPDGTVRAKDPASILAVDKARVADVSKMYDSSAVLERGSPEFGVKIQSDGKPYVGGPKLPEGFYSLDSFNDFTKEVAKTLEDSRQQGKTYSVWYQKIGTGEDGSWAQSVKRGLGNIKVGQSEIAFLGWRLSKAGNILAQAVDITALRGRMLDFARSGKGRINEIWGGDLASYEKDVMKYLDNHANSLPGDNGLGTAKRDAINYLFGITNQANKGINPMYSEGRPPGSLVKSYRLDRIANSRDTGRTGFFIDYQKQATNLAPATPEQKQLSPATSAESRNLEINRKDREIMARVPLKPEDKQIIKNASSGKTKLSSGARAEEKMVESRVREVKARFPQASGWAKIDLADVEIIKSKKAGEDPKISPVFKTVPYSFEKDPSTGKDTATTHAARVEDHSNKVVSELMKVVDRAKSGDKNAQKILGHKTWYRGMNEVLRRSFGGMADYFADLLGAFSPNTSVDINWRFGVEALGRVARGDYDKILSKVDEWVKSGRTISEYKKEGNPMILQENQKLFGMNSDNGMIAMLDMWRDVQAGQAPKARNFALNLVGQSLKATIDVWAARFLQRMAGLERVPTVAESGVSGNVLTDTSRVGGQFGYGQEVFESVVQKLKKSGIEDLKDLTAPDLQAIVWFLEKEIWAENNWTSKTGEGGSFETEADLTQPSRYVIGLSQETPEVKPTAEQQASFASDIRNTFAEAPGVIATKIKDSIGAFMGTTERSFDAEFVVTPDFDPSKLIEVTASKAMQSGQKNAFVSRVLGPNEDNANARPGMEIYLRKKGSMGDVNALAKQVSEAGIDGFTMIVDPRAKVAGVPDEFIGVRYQYVPEFSGDKNWQANVDALRGKLQDLADNLMSQSEIAFANVVKYDTLVLGEKDYGNFNTGTGTGYTEGRGASWIGRADSARNEASIRGIESGKQTQRPTGFQRVGNESRQPAKADLESEVKKRAIKEELLSPAKLLTRKRGVQ